jgi:hypothetical protein
MRYIDKYIEKLLERDIEKDSARLKNDTGPAWIALAWKAALTMRGKPLLLETVSQHVG